MGAPVGNKNAAKAKVWQAAIIRALENRSKLAQKNALDDLAEALLTKCSEGDMVALKELGDRLDGKVAQAIIGGEEGDPLIRTAVTVEFVGARPAT